MKKERNHERPRVNVPRPQRIRRIEGAGFAWLDARLKHQGWLEVLGPEALAVYAFLCLAADRTGTSWYRRDRIAACLGMSQERLRHALGRLYELDLVAYRPFGRHASDGFHQVLSLPPVGPPALEDVLASALRVSR